MIVETDFLDHWKTKLLIELLGDEAAPLLLVRLWSHCHQRRTDRFAELKPVTLKAICSWKGEAEVLMEALLEAGFLDTLEENEVHWTVVHDFRVTNATLFANWENGRRGGRPKGTGKTQTKPNGNPSTTDRVDRRDRIEGIEGIEWRESPPTPSGVAEGPGVEAEPLPGSKRARRSMQKARTPAEVGDPLQALMLALNPCFRRVAVQAWTADEVQALEASGLVEADPADALEAISLVARFYRRKIPREMTREDAMRFCLRTTMKTLLEHWPAEVDKARRWERESDDGVTKL